MIKTEFDGEFYMTAYLVLIFTFIYTIKKFKEEMLMYKRLNNKEVT